MENVTDVKCKIWNTVASAIATSGDYIDLSSARAGGIYRITNSALAILCSNDSYQRVNRVKLTNWLVEQRRQGVLRPIIDTTILKSVIGAENFSVTARVDRLLIWLSDNIPGLGQNLPIGTSILNFTDKRFLRELVDELCAFTGSQDEHEALELLDFSIKAAYADASQYRSNEGGYISLTYRGYQHVEALRSLTPLSQQAFVAMWFSKQMDFDYADGFEPGIRDAGYLPIRIDRKEHNNKIDDEIIAEIRRSRFLVADFTSEIVERETAGGKVFKDTHARGGVYFEAGFAKGLGKEVIWSVREDVLPFVHFDTRQFAHIVWKDPDDLRSQLSRRISATLGDGPHKKSA
jgi:hypothetical protein